MFVLPLFVLLVYFFLSFNASDLFSFKKTTFSKNLEDEKMDDYVDELSDQEMEVQFLLRPKRVLTELDALEEGLLCPTLPCSPQWQLNSRSIWNVLVPLCVIFCLSMLEITVSNANGWLLPKYHLMLLASISMASIAYGLLVNFAINNGISSMLCWIGRVFAGVGVLSIFNMIVLFVLYPIKNQFVDGTKYTTYWNFYSFFFFLFLSISLGILWDFLQGRKPLLNGSPSAGDKNQISLYDKLLFLLPFLWPVNNLRYRIYVILSLFFIVIGRIVNVMVPVSFKILTDSLREGKKFPLNLSATTFLMFFVLGKLFQGNVGIISSIQKLFWIPVNQWSTEQIAKRVFSHLHALSHSFHTLRKTGEVVRILDKGTSSVGSLLNSMVFSIGPTLIDVAIAVVFFIITFDIWFGLIILSTMSLFVSLTVVLTRWRVGFRRQMANLDAVVSGKAVDSLLNFETVKHFNAEHFEISSYLASLKEYLVADWICQTSLIALNTVQNSLISIGALFVGSYLTIQRLGENDQMSVGDLILFLTYIGQLYMPLNYLGTYYRTIQQHFIDMEKVIELLNLPLEITDDLQARPLQVKKGEIVFGTCEHC